MSTCLPDSFDINWVYLGQLHVLTDTHDHSTISACILSSKAKRYLVTITFLQCFTPLQVSRFLVEAHPYPIDIFTIIRCASDSSET